MGWLMLIGLLKSSGMSVVGQWPYGPMVAVEVDTTRGVYFASNGATVRVYARVPSLQPVAEWRTPNGRQVRDLDFDEATQRLYVAAGELYVLDVSDYQNITLATSQRYPLAVTGVVLDSAWIYVLENPETLNSSVVPSGYIHIVDPQTLSDLGVLTYPGTRFTTVARRDTVLYANSGTGIALYSIADLQNPYRITSLGVLGNRTWVHDTLLFVGMHSDPYAPFRIYDISDPAAPQELWNYSAPVAEILIRDTLLLVVRNYPRDPWSSGVDVFRFVSPSSPTLLSAIPVPALDVGMHGVSVVTMRPSVGLYTVDLTDPTAPVPTDSTDDAPGNIRRVEVSGNVAYVAAEGGFWTVDLSNPAQPTTLAMLRVPEARRAAHLTVHNGYAFLARGGGGLSILNVQDPTLPYLDTVLFSSGQDVNGTAAAGNALYVSGYDYGASAGVLWTLDITVPSSPVESAVDTLTGSNWGLVGLGAGRLYWVDLAGSNARVFSLANPWDPQQIGSCSGCLSDDPVSDMDFAGNIGVVATWRGAFQYTVIWDLTDSTAPTPVASLPPSAAVVISGGVLYSGEGNLHFRAYNITDSSNPVFIGELRHRVTDLAADSPYVVAVTPGDGFRILLPIPVLREVDFAIVDTFPGANADSVLDPGEQATLVWRVTNVSNLTASNVTAELSVSLPLVGVSGSPQIISANPGDTLPLVFTLTADSSISPGLEALLSLTLSGGNIDADTIQQTIRVGRPFWTADIAGGPYVAITDADSTFTPLAPRYAWVDLGSSGTPLALGDDDRAPVALPFTFTFYGQPFDTLWVCSNGWIALGSDPGTNEFRNDTIGDPALPDIFVAPLWDDLNPSSGGQILYGYDSTAGGFVVSFLGVPHYGTSETETFQVIFLDPAVHPTTDGNGMVLFQYQADPPQTDFTTGIEFDNGSGTVYGVAYAFDGTLYEGADPIVAGRAVLFTTEPVKVAERQPVAPLRAGLRVLPRPGYLDLRMMLPWRSPVRILAFDAAGRRVARWDRGVLSPGEHRVKLVLPTPSGIYFIRVDLGREQITRRVLFLRRP